VLRPFAADRYQALQRLVDRHVRHPHVGLAGELGGEHGRDLLWAPPAVEVVCRASTSSPSLVDADDPARGRVADTLRHEVDV